MDIYDKIKEIQELAKEILKDKTLLIEQKDNGNRIMFLCEQILIDHQTQQALKKLENEPYKPKQVSQNEPKRLHP